MRMRRSLAGLLASLVGIGCMALAGCSGLSSGAGKNTDPPPSAPTGTVIPSSFFGMIVNKLSSYPLQLPYGQWRGWDSGGAQWPQSETCEAQSGQPSDPCFTWKNLDIELADIHAAGMNDVLFTVSRSPLWAVDLASDPTGQKGTDCNYYKPDSNSAEDAPGQCLPPTDLNPDGSGSNQIWKNWITALATHVNDDTYLQTHTHIKMWEPWNEWHRSTVVTNYVGVLSFQGTYAQMVRLTEDLRCIITGKGTIHNYPLAGQSTPCTASPIDPGALIVTPSSSARAAQSSVMQNFLYCNGTGSRAPVSGSRCTTGNAGSQAVDIIDYHLYANTRTPETLVADDIPIVLNMLQPADKAKPMMNGESSWGDISQPNVLWKDSYAQAGFIPRMFALYWSAGVRFNYWYAYDDVPAGELFDPIGQKLLHPQADAWVQTYNWLVGSKPSNNPFCSNRGTVYTCDFVEPSGTAAELVWDAQYGQTCSGMATPIICGTTQYNVPTQFSKDWVDLSGTVHPPSTVVTIGANPIMLEGQ